MDTSQFDPASFLDASVSEAMTRRPPIPAGTELIGTVMEIKTRSWASDKNGVSKSGIAADVPVEFDLSAYPNIQQVVGVDKVTLSGSVFLDIENGALSTAPGKNTQLRRWREATNLNQPGQAFSLRQMTGRQVKVRIKHRLHEGENYDEIDSVARA